MEFDLKDYPVSKLKYRLAVTNNRTSDKTNHVPPDSKNAAVLVPLIAIEKNWHLLLTKRTEKVKSHKGQISFPGGQFDTGDPDMVATALREANEEIGITQDDVQILGSLNEFLTVSKFLVVPVVGVLNWPIDLHLSHWEVSKVLTIPLYWFANPAHQKIEHHRHGLQFEGEVIYYQEYKGEIVWGITAQIILDLVNTLIN